MKRFFYLSLIFFVILFILFSTVAEIPAVLFTHFTHAPKLVGSVVSNLVAVLIWYLFDKLYLKSDMRWTPIKNQQHWWFMLFGLIVIGGDMTLGPKYDFSLNKIVTALVLGFMVGIIEEYVFRGLLINFVKKYFQLSPIKLAATSAIIFGLAHLPNVISSGSLINTIAQILAAIGAGFFFAVIYLITNNLWMPIIIHGLIDANDQLAFSSMSNAVGTSIVTGVIYFVAFLAIGTWLLKKYQPTVR